MAGAGTELDRLVLDEDLDGLGRARPRAELASAATATNSTMVSVCVQRAGDLIRVDRFPLRDHERHLDPLPPAHTDDLVHERGCGNVVSRTPPGAVVAAAELASRVVIDQVKRGSTFAATVVEVLQPQPGAPYNRLGLVAGSTRSTGDTAT